MKRFRLYEMITGLAVFVVAAVTYLLTVEPSVPFWDCGEFIASADKLEVGHPPGAPFFMLVGRVLAAFTSDPTHVAKVINSFSALCSAATILFLFWTITHLARKIVVKDENDFSLLNMGAILGAGVVGALAYTFSDTFWFSAVEGEVYAFSSFFTAIVFWCILRWEDAEDLGRGTRWIVFIAYLMGLSVGVHLLNLLAIPAIVLVYYFKKTKKVDWKGVLKALGASFVILLFVLYGLIPGFTKVAGVFELFFVNKLSMPFNTGLLIYIVCVAGLFVWTIYETHKTTNAIRIKISFSLLLIMLGIPFLGSGIWFGLLIIAAGVALLFYKKEWNYKWFNTITLSILVMVVGYSSYALIMVRSAANTPMDQNSPEDVFSLQSYLNREQYGSAPLLYGETFASPMEYEADGTGRCTVKIKYGNTEYVLRHKSDGNAKDEYVDVGKAQKGVEYVSNGKMLFPRMFSRVPYHVAAYKQWTDFKGRRIKADQCGQMQEFIVPTMGENLKFFFSYQLNFMYWRYFMWNFVGRQNDIQSNNGEIDAGQWISGIPFIDNALYGDQSKLPDYLKNNKGHNRYFFLPLILGILGIIWQLSKAQKGKQQFWLTFVLFFMTGIAIVLYVNQTPYQPRERDYSYAGSFYAFCIWIGFGMLALAKGLQRLRLSKSISVPLAFVLSMGIPILMAAQNWDDHDRSGRYVCRDTAYNYLNSCKKNAILFCNGDNDTFPLWYSQEVEGVRDDIRTCNLSYIPTEWYIDQMKRPYYNGAPLPIDFTPDEYQKNSLDITIVHNHPAFGGKLDAAKAFELLRDKNLTIDKYSVLLASTLTFPVDKQKVIEAGVVAPQDYDNIVDTISLKITQQTLSKGDLAVLNMLKNNDWSRPIYFCTSVGSDFYPTKSIDEYSQCEGLAYRFVPVKKNCTPNNDAMYDNMMNKFRYNLTGKNIYLDETNTRMCKTLRQSFGNLAYNLALDGDTVRAKAVLAKAAKEIPEKLLHYDYATLIFAETYYKIGDQKQGDYVLGKIVESCRHNLDYVLSLPIKKQSYVSPELTLRQNLGTLQRCVYIANDNKSPKTESIAEIFQRYYTILASSMQ